MEDLVEAMLGNSQALAEALAADRARLDATDRIQRESWETARRLQRSVVEMQAEMERLRAEAADAKKKLQSDESRKMRWEAAHHLLLGANQKLAELRDGDMEDFRTCAETPNSKEAESCKKLSQRTTDHIASDTRKQKQAYETLSSKKDKEISALLSERGSLHSQMDIMQKNYAELLKNKKVEADQATEEALKLQQSVDELKVLAQKKDDEIGRLQAEAVGARRSLQNMHSLVKEKDDEIQRLKGRHPKSVEKRNKDFSETHKKSRFGDPAVTAREPENHGIRQTVEEDYISKTKIMETNVQDETIPKHRHASSMMNDDEQIRNDEDGGKQTGSDEDCDEQSRSNDDGDQQSSSGDDDGQSRSDEQSGSAEETTDNPIQKPLRNLKRNRDACNAEAAYGKSHSEVEVDEDVEEVEDEGNVPDEMTLKQFVLSQSGDFNFKPKKSVRCYTPPELNKKLKGIVDESKVEPAPKKTMKRMTSNEEEPTLNSALKRNEEDEKSGSDEDDAEQIGSDEDGDKHSGSDVNGGKQSGSGEDGDEQSGSGEDGDGDNDNECEGDLMRRLWYWRPPAPLRTRKLKIFKGQRFYNCTGHWGQYVKAVNDSLSDQPDKHKEFIRFLRNFQHWRIRDVARTMEVLLDGQPKLIRQFNRFLPNNCQIWVKEEKQQPEMKRQRRLSRLRRRPPSAAAAAGLIKLSKEEQQLQREQV